MKKVVIAVLAASCAIPAMAGDVYLSGSVGRSSMDVDDYGTSLSANPTSFTLAVGYQVNRNFGVEAGSVHFGKVDMRKGAAYFNCDNPAALYAALTASWPATESLSLYAKGGVVRSENQVLNNPASATQTHLSPLLGVGAGYALTPKVNAFAEYLNFGKTVDQDGITMKAATLAAGIRYTF